MTAFRHSPKRIVLHVDRLLLRGVERADATAISAGLQAELRALLASDGAAAALAAHDGLPAVQAGRVPVPPAGDATSIGRAVAERIVRGPKP